MLFKKRKTELEEVPLYYWEEKSYMLVIPKDENEDLLKDCLNRITTIKGVEVLENNYSLEDNAIYLKLVYDKDEYDVGIYVGNVSVPEYYLNKNFLFTEQEREDILNAQKALTIFMKFNKDEKKSYHFQLKLAVAMVPNLIGIMDESAEKMLPAKWVKMTSDSNILPSPKNLFTVQAVMGEDKKVWLHTHGLCRCGITELEILESDEENYRNHYNLITTYAMYLLDKKDENSTVDNGSYIGCLIDGTPIVATCVSWTKGILEYKNLKLGNLEDRKDSHNSKTSIIFLYKSEEDENNKKISKVSIYDKLWGENPIFFISDKETNRMKELAIERFSYIKDAFKNKENAILIKIGLPLKEKDKYEHIWFELQEIKGNKFKAKLTQEPYDIKNIHEGDEAWYQINDITDWIIYTKEFAVIPDNAYLLERD